jgi:hypothetical protein
MTKLFNIAALAVAATAVIHVKDANGQPAYADAERKLPLLIHLHGPGSQVAGIVESRQSARALKRYQDNDGKMIAASPEQRIGETADDLATLTARFENFDHGDGTLTGEALYRSVYAEPSLGFITKQVAKHFGDWGNFSVASQTA